MKHFIPSDQQKDYLDGSKRRSDGLERDSQRTKVYDSEWSLLSKFHGAALPTVPIMQAYVDGVCRSDWWLDRFDPVNITIGDGRSRRSACVQFKNSKEPIIKMPHFARYELILLHELAHIVIPNPHASHGRLFTRTFLELVQHYIGQDAYEALRKQFRYHGVQWSARARA